MLQNIKAIFLDLGGTFREVNGDRAYSLAARKRIAEILCPAADPDSYYEYINKKYDVYREWALRWTCEAPEEELWCRWLVPELPREAVAPHAKELTYCFRAAKGRRLFVGGGKAQKPQGRRGQRQKRRPRKETVSAAAAGRGCCHGLFHRRGHGVVSGS